MPPRPWTTEELEALEYLRQQIDESRRTALRRMFGGSRLVLKKTDAAKRAKEVKDDLKAVKSKVGAIPGLALPSVDMSLPRIDLWPHFDLPKIQLHLPKFDFPDFPNLSIPNIRLPELPGFDLPSLRLRFPKLKFDWDLLPDITLPQLLSWFAFKLPGLNLPYLALQFELNFNVNLRRLLPDLFNFDLNITLPNIPDLPHIGVPSLPDLMPFEINLPTLKIPDFDMPAWLKIPGFSKVLELLYSLFDAVDIGEIIAEIGLDALKDFISAALPIIGQLKSGFKAAQAWINTAQSAWKTYKVGDQKKSLLPGNARDAAEGVKTLLKTRTKQLAATATTLSAQFAVSTAGLFADLGAATGPATSAAAALVKVMQKIFALAAEYKQAKAANKILDAAGSTGYSLTSDIFKAAPILGAYYLTCTETSDIINLLTNDMTECFSWMMEVEKHKSIIDPLLVVSSQFIQEAHYELSPPPAFNKGKFLNKKVGFLDKLKAKFSSKPKSTYVGISSQDVARNGGQIPGLQKTG